MKHTKTTGLGTEKLLILLVLIFGSCGAFTIFGNSNDSSNEIDPFVRTHHEQIMRDGVLRVNGSFIVDRDIAFTVDLDAADGPYFIKIGNNTYRKIKGNVFNYEFPKAGTYSVTVVDKKRRLLASLDLKIKEANTPLRAAVAN